jgi:hypothetical protein
MNNSEANPINVPWTFPVIREALEKICCQFQLPNSRLVHQSGFFFLSVSLHPLSLPIFNGLNKWKFWLVGVKRFFAAKDANTEQTIQRFLICQENNTRIALWYNLI